MIDLSFGTKQFHEKDQKILRHWLDKIEAPCPNILEIGCWTGQSTAVICAYLRSLPHWNGRVHVIDPFEGTSDSKLPQLAKEYDIRAIFEHNMKMLGFEKFIEVHQGLSQDKFFLFPNNSFDFIFVDGDHKYSGVIKDLELYWPKLRPGGIMIGHDYDGNVYHIQHIEREFADNKHHGVIAAVNEFFKVGENSTPSFCSRFEHHSHFFVAIKSDE